MPLTHFICTDGEQIDIGSCLQSCRLGRRCLTLPTLLTIASGERPWAGKPSITRLLNGTMLEFLKNKVPFASAPKSRAFMLHGNAHHEQLEKMAEGNVTLAEVQQGNQITGIPDVLELDELDPTKYVLTDYKTYGSYRVSKLLGMVKHNTLSTTEVYKTNTKWGQKGMPKKVVTWSQNPASVDAFDEEMQLNGYRLLLEERGYPISRMQIQVTVRDGGLQVATQRGITETMYMIDITRLADNMVIGFFGNQQNQLQQAMELGVWDVPCNDRESWDGLRCQKYCEVALACPKGKIELQKVANKT